MSDDFLNDLGLDGDTSALVAETTFTTPDCAPPFEHHSEAVRWALRDLAGKISRGEMIVEGVPAEAKHFGITLKVHIVGTGSVNLAFRFTRTPEGVVPWSEDEQVEALALHITETTGRG
jgi:hypothetical protein